MVSSTDGSSPLWAESPFQGGVFFDMLAVLVEGGSPDAVQLSPCKHRLQEVAGINGTFGSPGATTV